MYFDHSWQSQHSPDHLKTNSFETVLTRVSTYSHDNWIQTGPVVMNQQPIAQPTAIRHIQKPELNMCCTNFILENVKFFFDQSQLLEIIIFMGFFT